MAPQEGMMAPLKEVPEVIQSLHTCGAEHVGRISARLFLVVILYWCCPSSCRNFWTHQGTRLCGEAPREMGVVRQGGTRPGRNERKVLEEGKEASEMGMHAPYAPHAHTAVLPWHSPALATPPTCPSPPPVP